MRALIINCAVCLAVLPAALLAQSGEADEEAVELSGSLDDADGSLDIVDRDRDRDWTLTGDLRGGYSHTVVELADGTEDTQSAWQGRFRAGGRASITEWLLARVRLAMTCSTNNCDPNWIFGTAIPASSGLRGGDITFDELLLHSYRRERFDFAVGRMQTRFVARAGVFAKSLDRNDSGGTSVTWTDGLHGTMHFTQKWVGHLIVQRNSSEGSGSVRRGPLDFSPSSARNTYFLAWQNLRRWRFLTQRGFDITYMPESLQKDGVASGRVEDYWGFVARFAGTWPYATEGLRLNVAGELGYAPETPTRSASGLGPDAGDTSGSAWNISISAVDFMPDHSFGINYGETEAGWLLSPDYRENEKIFEARYLWRRSRNMALDIRARWRQDIELRENATRRQEDLNVFARFTLGFGN